ncbi:TLC domain-containing protein 5-like [Pectinophora gossypiella]|uniref:TLC domain-containing protein 5-like n=1 Tax=Pectinophora gossypiella TaxID=13191 RepID=UPI00214E3164|nr:TLC domain-containing protein 5-like [Pectinophora gossypiella]
MAALPLSILLKIASFLFWSLLYLKCAVEAPDREPEWWSRVVTLLHSSIASLGGVWQCGVTGLTKCSFTTPIGYRHHILMLWSWGYFAFDLMWCLIYWPDHKLMLVHHMSALGAVTWYMNKEYTGCTFSCTLALMEVTNPLLQMRWLLRSEGYGTTIMFYILEVVYLVSFVGLRGVLGTYLIFKIMATDIFEMDAKIISIVFYIVSIALISEIFSYVIYKYKNKLEEFQGVIFELGIILNDQV